MAKQQHPDAHDYIYSRKLVLCAFFKNEMEDIVEKEKLITDEVLCLDFDEFYDLVESLEDDPNVVRSDEYAVITYDEAISLPYLFYSMLKCRHGVLWKTSVISYYEHSLGKLQALEQELKSDTYHPKPPVHFVITAPKRRDIVAVSFEDRIVQRSLNDNIIYPIMTKSFIDQNCACRKGKGTDYGRDLLIKYLRREFINNNNSNDFYCLQIDIHGYYPNMDHAYIEKLFRDKLDDKTYQFVIAVLHSQYPGDIGYNPGSQLIQIAGISCLNSFDHWCKEQKHCRYYIRYMDDIIILHQDKEFLQHLKCEIEGKLKEIGFSFNPRKTRIYHQKHRIRFLGFLYFINDTGKVIVLPDGKTLKRDYKHWDNMTRAIINHKFPKLNEDKLIQSIESTLKYIERSNSYKLTIKIKQKEKDLLLKIKEE